MRYEVRFVVGLELFQCVPSRMIAIISHNTNDSFLNRGTNEECELRQGNTLRKEPVLFGEGTRTLVNL